MSPQRRQVGHTKDAGWQIGVSKTVDHPIEQVWDLLTSPAGRAIWLGHGVKALDEPGRAYDTTEGTAGEVRTFQPGDRIRLSWQPDDWDHETTVQVALTSSASDRTSIRFHQERLASAEERTQQRAHWRKVMDALVEALDQS